MDTKSLARSKRAHSQQNNKKFHPNPKPKPQQQATTATSVPSKSSGKQIAEKKPRKPALPSNWDRYEDEFDSSLGTEGTSGSNNKVISGDDVVVPKSKGADFGYLISEAQSQLGFGSVDGDDNVLSDYHQGISSMLSVRGNGMLSWIGNDNFIVDDRSATSDEVSFLSLDLHSLASKLEKLDLSQRLFIEADILPPALDVDRLNEAVQPESEQAESHASRSAEQCLDEFAFLEHSNKDMSVHHSSMVMPSTATSSYSSLPGPHQGAVLGDPVKEAMPATTTVTGRSVQYFSCEGTSITDLVKNDSIQIEPSIFGEVVDSIARFNVNDVENSKESKGPRFEALAAEAELDMLLNSFGEFKLPNSSGMSKKLRNSLSVAQWGDSTTLSEENSSKQPSGQGSNSSRSVLVNGDIDDTIDDLLQEKTSNIKNQNTAVSPQKVVIPLYLPPSSSKATGLLDDFDSWLDTI